MPPSDTIPSIADVMTRIARELGRRDFVRAVERKLGSRMDHSFLLVVDAIDELGKTGEPPTIKDVARHMDVHHSRASRLVKDTIRAGLVTRLASQEDARKSPLALSGKGQEIAIAIRGARERYFALRLHGLSKSDRRNLADLLERFAENAAGMHGKDERTAIKTGRATPGRKQRTRKHRKNTA